MDIQNYSADKAREIAELFHQSVHAIAPWIYSPEQKEAWASSPVDYERWAERLKRKQPLLALIDGRVAGFMELDADGHIDCAYTHPDFQRRGVASALYAQLLAQARARNLTRLHVEASLVARPFFERRGFTVLRKNEVQRQGVILVNFLMEKTLKPSR